MIWRWLMLSLRYIGWLILPLSPKDVARIDPNAKCPVCGAKRGKLRAMVVQAKNAPDGRVMCEHTCLVDGARWYESPVFQATPSTVRPSVARDELEKAADAEALLMMGRGGRS